MNKKQFILPEIKTYFGGKGSSGTYQKIINQIPPHDTRIIGCLGACSITKFMEPAFINIGIEPDIRVINAWENGCYPDKLILYDNLFLFNGKFEDYIYSLFDLFGRVFIYLDPPYPMDSRKDGRKRYPFEMTDKEHINMLKIVLNLPCYIAISSYYNKIYSELLADWRYIKFKSSTRHGMATEYLYMNYDEPTELHDYQYLGNNSSMREDIKNKFKRFQAKFNRLSQQEQSMWRQFINH